MVTVISRPLGHKLTDASLPAEVFDSSGEALFITTFAHGLVDGDYVYVQSNIEAYNGYKYVDSVAYNEFKLRESENGDYIQFKQEAEVTYRISVLSHGYLAISQPIVYELESNLFPVNVPEDTYTPRTVVSQSDAEGYTRLELSTGIADIEELDFVELSGVGDLAGSYQITTKFNAWSIVINLPYDAANVFTGYNVIKYYNNYCINVDIYSGLGAEHPWYAEEPYEMAATLRFTPDANGRVKFSISDILKGFIETRNNLTLNTLPNNLDFMTAFYIAYYESYDQSDGDEITTFESAPESDIAEFEGHAINADMPFKSVYISHMSEYLNEDTYLAKWLLLQTRPVAIVGYFFDLSFLNRNAFDILIKKNGVDFFTIPDPGPGVIRVPLEFNEAGEACIQAFGTGSEVLDNNDFQNNPGSGTDWIPGANPSVTRSSIGSTDTLYKDYTFIAGVPYIITLNFTVVGAASGGVFAKILDSSFVEEFSDSDPFSGSSATLSFTATEDSDKIGITATWFNNVSATITLTSVTVEVDDLPITEEICVEVLEECDNTFISDDDIRLTEDGDFRILE